MINDVLSDLLTRIRNGCLNNSQEVLLPLTRLSQQICYTLGKEGFIESSQRHPSLNNILVVKLKYKDPILGSTTTKFSSESVGKEKSSIKNSQALGKKRPCITNLKRISKPGLRVYARHKQIPTVLGGLGILILSTPKGIMTDREARFRKVGGEILCSIW